MSDIFMYKSLLKIQHNRSDEIAKRLPLVFRQRLYDVVARDIEVKPSLVTFHGSASRTVTKHHRWVTSWNLLAGISRGAIQIKNNYPTLTVSYWLGFPKWFLLPLLGFGFFAILFFSTGERGIMLMTTVVIVMAGISLTSGILRFHCFVRSCVNQAKREVEKQLSPL